MEKRLLNLYVYSIIALGFFTAVLQLKSNQIEQPLSLLLLLFAGILFALRIELFHGRTYQGSSIIVFLTYFMHGLTEALVVVTAISAFEAIYYRSGLKKGLFNYGMDLLGMTFASGIYEWLGGAFGANIGTRHYIRGVK